MCNTCFTNDVIYTTTVFTMQYNDCVIVVKNVPCKECPKCGEILFTDDVSKKLEELVDAAKKLMQDVAVLDYKKTA